LQVTLKLFASLGSFLPTGSMKNKAEVDVESDTTILALLDRHNVPREKCHLVLLNGVFYAPEDRATTALKEGDVVAVWPPVAGG
jgi:thiamine biosynthesis protein ThiS